MREVLAQWFVEQGWLPTLSCLNLLLVVRVLFWMRGMSLAVMRVETKYQGVQERVQYAINKASSAEHRARQATGEASVVQPPSDPHADTRIKEPK